MQNQFAGRIFVTTITICIAGFLLFFRLGHCALWDDEADTALFAQSVWRTGDTSAVLDNNIVAYRCGTNLHNLRERLHSPLQSYLAAPFVGLLGNKAFAARLPFTLCGLGTVVLLLMWLWKNQTDTVSLAFWALGLLGNVSFFLFCRQARYYAPVILTSLAMAWMYLRWDGHRRTLIWFSIVSLLLFASNYLCYAAVNAALAVDFVVAGRKAHRRLALGDWLCLLLPQLLGAVVIASIWNPLGMDPQQIKPFHDLSDRLTFFLWNWRDLDRCEFGALTVLLLAPVCFRFARDAVFLRAPLALLVYVTVVAFVSPQQPGSIKVADVRYLVPIIPLCIAIEVGCLRRIKIRLLAFLLASLLFGTNIFHGGFWMARGTRSSIADFAQELADPPADSFTAAAKWINDNVAPAQTLFTWPDWTTYPLMFHAPRAVYAWQLTWPPSPQFSGLPPIHFQGQEAPDYLIAFGPYLKELVEAIRKWNRPDVHYAQVATIDTFWYVVNRPELFNHVFNSITNFDTNTEAIYVFKRTVPPVRD